MGQKFRGWQARNYLFISKFIEPFVEYYFEIFIEEYTNSLNFDISSVLNMNPTFGWTLDSLRTLLNKRY
jgi:hypothetical protein